MIELIPGNCIGDWCLGINRDDLRTLVNAKFTSRDAEKDTYFEGFFQPAMDYFPELGLKVEYDAAFLSTFMEVDQRTKLIFKGRKIFDLTIEEWSEILIADFNIQSLDTGFSIPEIGLAFNAKAYNDHHQHTPIDLVSIFKTQ